MDSILVDTQALFSYIFFGKTKLLSLTGENPNDKLLFKAKSITIRGELIYPSSKRQRSLS